MSKTEEVGRAIEEVPEWPAATYRQRVAKAAIDAMKKPTAAMLDAAWEATRNAPRESRIAVALAAPKDAHDFKMRQRWSAMITAALSE